MIRNLPHRRRYLRDAYIFPMRLVRAALKSIWPRWECNASHSFAPAWKCWDLEEKEENSAMSALVLIGAVEMSKSGDRDVAVFALGIVRDGVITGEGMLKTPPGARVS
jgi:hypothetical protein